LAIASKLWPDFPREVSGARSDRKQLASCISALRPGDVRKAVADFLNGGKWALVKEYVEVETGKRDDGRSMLADATKACDAYGATVVIVKLDRLSPRRAFPARSRKGRR
jgi:DNA invertase Pin-like site-specific DNA recombinase